MDRLARAAALLALAVVGATALPTGASLAAAPALFGTAEFRVGLASPMPRSRPWLIGGTTVGSVSTRASMWPPIAYCTAGAPPVNGTCTAFTLATSRKKYSAPICGPVPTPALP